MTLTCSLGVVYNSLSACDWLFFSAQNNPSNIASDEYEHIVVRVHGRDGEGARNWIGTSNSHGWAARMADHHTNGEASMRIPPTQLLGSNVSFPILNAALCKSKIIVINPSQIVFLLARPCVLVQAPLDISIFILQGSSSYFETSHCHSGANFRQLDALIACFDEDMVSYFDAVFDIFKCHDSTSELAFVRDGFARWEDVF